MISGKLEGSRHMADCHCPKPPWVFTARPTPPGTGAWSGPSPCPPLTSTIRCSPVRQPDQEVGAVLVDHAVEDVVTSKPRWSFLTQAATRGLWSSSKAAWPPRSSRDAEIDVRPCRRRARLPGVPGPHVAGGADRPVPSKTGSSVSVFAKRICSKICCTILRMLRVSMSRRRISSS